MEVEPPGSHYAAFAVGFWKEITGFDGNEGLSNGQNSSELTPVQEKDRA